MVSVVGQPGRPDAEGTLPGELNLIAVAGRCRCTWPMLLRDSLVEGTIVVTCC